MPERGSWERFVEYYVRAAEIGVDVSRMRFDESLLADRDADLRRALADMARLEAGALANPDEQRMVGHYWLRDAARAPTGAIRREIEGCVARVRAFARSVHEGRLRPPRARRFRNLLVVGIGGSALGPQFVARALGQPGRDPISPHFIDNTDPDGMDGVLATLGAALRETLTVVISKSGGTRETRNGMVEVRQAYEAAGLAFGPHAVATTQAGSELDRYAVEHGFLARFPMWDWVGGRTSVLSAVGLLPAALQGLDVRTLLGGARAMDAATREGEPRRNAAALLALVWHHAGEGSGTRDMVVLPYKDRLELFSRYLQQLVMESLGKERDLGGRLVHQGLVVYGNKGSTDQHAYVQQLRDGPDNFFATFIEVLRDRRGRSRFVEPGVTSGDYLSAFLQGTRAALAERGRRSITITVPDVSAATVGKLVALHERAVGLYAALIGINAYHQPGVEAGKRAAAAVLDVQRRALGVLRGRRGRGLTAAALAQNLGIPEATEMVFTILRHLAANPDHGVRRHPGPDASGWRDTYTARGDERRDGPGRTVRSEPARARRPRAPRS